MLNVLIVIKQCLLKKENKIWEKISNLMNTEFTEFDSEPVCGGNNKYIKTKIKLYGYNANANFQG